MSMKDIIKNEKLSRLRANRFLLLSLVLCCSMQFSFAGTLEDENQQEPEEKKALVVEDFAELKQAAEDQESLQNYRDPYAISLEEGLASEMVEELYDGKAEPFFKRHGRKALYNTAFYAALGATLGLGYGGYVSTNSDGPPPGAAVPVGLVMGGLLGGIYGGVYYGISNLLIGGLGAVDAVLEAPSNLIQWSQKGYRFAKHKPQK